MKFAGVPLIWKCIAAGAMVLAAVSLLVTAVLFTKLAEEGEGRRSATCETFEGAHLQEIQSVEKTYEYLLARPRDEWDATQQFIFKRSLPEAEEKARSDQDQLGQFVPLYCDAPEMGLPEVNGRDPDVPVRPRGLR